MRLLKFLIVMGALAIAAAWLTNPDEDAAEAELKTQVIQALQDLDLKPGAGELAAALCKMKLEDCYAVTRAAITTQFEDRTFYSVFRAEGFDSQISCIGAFTTFLCSGALHDR